MFNPDKHHDGAALVVTLILLFVITLVTLASARSSLMELRMATNSQARAEAFQYAQGALDYLAEQSLTNIDLLPEHPTDKIFCTDTASSRDDNCDQNTLTLPSPMNGSSGGTNSLRVTREECPPLPTGGSCGYCFRAESHYQGQADTNIAMGLRLGC